MAAAGLPSPRVRPLDLYPRADGERARFGRDDGAVEVDPGETWRFQCWVRDPPAGGATFNLTNAVSVDFIP